MIKVTKIKLAGIEVEEIQPYWPVLLVTIPLVTLFIEILTIRYFKKSNASLLNRLATVLMLAVMLVGISIIISEKLFESKVIFILLILTILVSTVSLQIKSSNKKPKAAVEEN